MKTGKVKVVWKDFPLTQLHPWAKPAAAAMECVYRKGGNDAFWAVKKKVFDNQNTLSTSNVQSQIISWAAQEGVSESAVRNCLQNGNPMQEVNADKQEGSSLGVSGTPTAFVGGVKLVGAQPYSRFKTVIENQLQG
ncbi:MAG: thioredoxin domain-containing protein [Candidatus Nanohaloarchaea archaeon]|nr:thioredoxin domain-containing protein [Candidatus Nanohaloarchaea archaeon]